jgi:hypothetical protein
VEELEDFFEEQGRKINPVLPSTTKNNLTDIEALEDE